MSLKERFRGVVDLVSNAQLTGPKFWGVVYLVGCVLLYFDVVGGVFSFLSGDGWKAEREDVPRDLLNAAVALVRPFLTVLVLAWIVALPPLILWGLFSAVTDARREVSRWIKRSPED